MTLILFAIACGLLLIIAIHVQQRRSEIVALAIAENGARNSSDTSKEFS